MTDLQAAERGAASVRQARIKRVEDAVRTYLHDRTEDYGDLFHVYPDGITAKIDGEFCLRELAEAVDKVI